MNHVPQFLTGQTVFIEGVGLLGTAKSIALPKVEQLREVVTQGGFERSLSTGVFKAMEAELTLSEYHPIVYKAINKQRASFVVKGSVTQKGVSKSVVATFKGSVDVDDGSWETKKELERKVKIFCDYYSLEVDGTLQLELDVENMIALIDGVDHLETLRKHIL